MPDSLILVDSDDRQIGTLDKEACHDGVGVRHRAFSVLLFDSRGRQLIQQRASGKRLWPLHWSNACCSHPRAGEQLEDAAHRRLREELGIDADIVRVHRFEYHASYEDRGSEYEVCSVFIGIVGDEAIAALAPVADEIEASRWMAAADLDAELAAQPDNFTPWFKMEWETVKSLPETTIGFALEP